MQEIHHIYTFCLFSSLRGICGSISRLNASVTTITANRHAGNPGLILGCNTLQLSPLQHLQLNNIFSFFKVPSQSNCRVDLETLQATVHGRDDVVSSLDLPHVQPGVDAKLHAQPSGKLLHSGLVNRPVTAKTFLVRLI
jgi:hypothetical protein